MLKQKITPIVQQDHDMGGGNGRSGSNILDGLSEEEITGTLKHHFIQVYGAFLHGVIDIDSNLKDALRKMLTDDPNFRRRFAIHHLSNAGEPLKDNLENLFEMNTPSRSMNYDAERMELSKQLVIQILSR